MSQALDQAARRLERRERLPDDEAEALFAERDVLALGALADRVRRARHGDRVYYRDDLNLNHTNVCAADCGFCAFYRKPGEKGAYVLSLSDIEAKARAAVEAGITEFHVVGGMTPECDLEYLEAMFRALKRVAPEVEIQGMTGVEVDFLAKLEKLSIEATLKRLVAAGLDSIPGGGAEVFHPEARKRMMATKIAGDRFLEVHETAHRLGIPTNVSILYGHVETPAERIDHLRRIRELQDKTGGFRAFTALRWNPENTALHAKTGAPGSTAFDDLRMVAIARLYLDNVDHVKLPWITIGKPMAQVALNWGVDDIGGSAFEERILDAAGARTWALVRNSDVPRYIREAGFEPVYAYGSYRTIRREEAVA
ncbi:MAG TPA: CofH family radical SAM protein [Candidatus Thermoplasmatota archaeon]|nr:CofH family radical SAM protein [Candidatus Thermoplasmatota archaeon]